MNKQILTAILALALPAAALADLSDTKTLTANNNLNLDTGATAGGTGGDILWSGSALTPQANAKSFDLGQLGSLDGLGKSMLDLLKSAASSASIPSSTLVVGEVLAVFTNGGNTAAVLVTANGGRLDHPPVHYLRSCARRWGRRTIDHQRSEQLQLNSGGLPQLRHRPGQPVPSAGLGPGRRWRCHTS